MKRQTNYAFRYVYVDGDYIRARVPGCRSISYNAKVYGTKRALDAALSARDFILEKKESKTVASNVKVH
jgi:hypothetical protein